MSAYNATVMQLKDKVDNLTPLNILVIYYPALVKEEFMSLIIPPLKDKDTGSNITMSGL